MQRLSAACWDWEGGGARWSLMPPNNTPVYSVLGLPLLKYISHIPMAPFNTEKCKGRLALPFLPTARREIHNDPLRNYLGFGGGGRYVCVCGVG